MIGTTEIWNLIEGSSPPRIEVMVTPLPKPRLTQGDRWWKSNLSKSCARGRRARRIQAYYKYVDEIKEAMQSNGVRLESVLCVEFHLPLPKSKRKKDGRPTKAGQRLLDGVWHRQTPDWDNLAKGVQDALLERDEGVYCGVVRKVWGMDGKVVFYLLER